MRVAEKINVLRQLMREKGLKAYIIVTDDFHGSEYVGEFFKAREFMSGFTGSAGSLVVMDDFAGLWTDGRYFLQAGQQLEGSGIELMKIGEEGVPTISEFLKKELSEGDRIGFDGRTISNSFAKKLDQFELVSDIDLVDCIWTDRPAISTEKVWELDIKYAGISAEEKIKLIREKLTENNADAIVLTALDEIAWTLNLRGNDVECTPVFLAFMVVDRDNVTLFVHPEIISADIKNKLNVNIKNYDDIYYELLELITNKKVIIDGSSANYRIMCSVPASTEVIDMDNPVILMKAVKNETEVENIKKAHIMDSVAVTKFMYWLEKNAGKGITELDAVSKLEKLRKENSNYIGPSFTSIVAYGSNGAIIHYEPTQETNTRIEKKGLCLCDVGGHYYQGTTDMTRTVVVGELSEEEKKAYTLVLKGHLNLGNTVFKYGLSGANLDNLARGPLWEYGMDYNHGTGHGVGYLLNVHEGPQRFHWRFKGEPVTLEEGMVISNEPGYYEDGQFGIRHENLVLVRKAHKSSYGQFMRLENLTFVPFDWRGISLELMNTSEMEYLINYQIAVFEKLKDYFEGEELEWLKEKINVKFD